MELSEIQDDKICIAKITILVVLPKELEGRLEPEEISYIESAVAQEYLAGLDRLGFSDEISIGQVKSEYGCLLISFPLLATLASGGVVVALKFLEKYPEYKAGAKELWGDVKYLYLKLRGREYKQGNCLREGDFATEEALKEAIKQWEESRNKNM